MIKVKIRSFCTMYILVFGLGFSGIVAQDSGTQGRTCATMTILNEKLKNNPALQKSRQDLEKKIQEYIRRGDHLKSGTVISIPIVFHIVHNGDALGSGENIPEALIMAQLAQLNDDFRRTNSDTTDTPTEFKAIAADTEIEFCLATVDPQGNATTGIIRHSLSRASWSENQIDGELLPSTIWDRDIYLNFWSVRFSENGLLGFAQFPGGPANTDGVVCTYTSLGSVAFPNPDGGSFAMGRTGTHEVGHWLNLFHIWGDGNCSADDLVADTPNQESDSNGCPSHPRSSCGSNDMFMNYMDYTDDDCMDAFSLGQKARMMAAISASRSSLLTATGCSATDDFELTTLSSSKSICPPADAAVYNLSVAFLGGFNSSVNLTVTGLPTGAFALISPSSFSSSGPAVLTITVNGVSDGTYNFKVEGAGGGINHELSLELIYVEQLPAPIVLNLPPDNTTGFSLSGALSWAAETNSDSYFLEIATDMAFADILVNQNIQDISYNITGLLTANTMYFWRVKGSNACGQGSYSAIRKFTTEDVTEICETFNSTDVPINFISDQTVSSTLSIDKNGTITNVIVRNIDITHSWIGDVVLSLKDPNDTRIDLAMDICDINQFENMNLDFDDEGLSAIPCPPTTGNAYKPLQALTAFDGMEISGDWVLEFSDDFPEADEDGILISWSLNICYEPTSKTNCIATDNLSGIISDGTYHFPDELTSTGTVPMGGNVIFKAPNAVNLLPNFEVKSNATFIATIENCND